MTSITHTALVYPSPSSSLRATSYQRAYASTCFITDLSQEQSRDKHLPYQLVRRYSYNPTRANNLQRSSSRLQKHKPGNCYQCHRHRLDTWGVVFGWSWKNTRSSAVRTEKEKSWGKLKSMIIRNRRMVAHWGARSHAPTIDQIVKSRTPAAIDTHIIYHRVSPSKLHN